MYTHLPSLIMTRARCSDTVATWDSVCRWVRGTHSQTVARFVSCYRGFSHCHSVAIIAGAQRNQFGHFVVYWGVAQALASYRTCADSFCTPGSGVLVSGHPPPPPRRQLPPHSDQHAVPMPGGQLRARRLHECQRERSALFAVTTSSTRVPWKCLHHIPLNCGFQQVTRCSALHFERAFDCFCFRKTRWIEEKSSFTSQILLSLFLSQKYFLQGAFKFSKLHFRKTQLIEEGQILLPKFFHTTFFK